MAQTNFASLIPDQKVVWSRQLWKAAREQMFINKFVGGTDSVIQRITELTRTEKGEQVLFQLLADLVSDGTVGDNQREGMEEALQSFAQKIKIDLIANQIRNKGKLADQKTVINFRENAKDALAYWLANRIDQLAFLTLSGISYSLNNDGSLRNDSTFSTLSFASDVSAPTTNRWRRWDNTAKVLTTGNTGSVVATDTISYKTLVDAKVWANTHYIKPMSSGGKEYYCVFLRPEAMAQLKLDPDYKNAEITGMERGERNPFFTGGYTTVYGLVLHEHRLVFNTKGAASGSKWGAGGNVDASRMLLCGSQALGMADLSAPEWNEKEFEYGTSQGISVDKMFGFVKPKFYSIYDKSVEDFGVLAIDHAIS
jgi:N4-gp56 family major capsid protein